MIGEPELKLNIQKIWDGEETLEKDIVFENIDLVSYDDIIYI